MKKLSLIMLAVLVLVGCSSQDKGFDKSSSISVVQEKMVVEQELLLSN